MSLRSLFNKLELAHAPLTAYEFAVVRNDSALEAALDRASLYIIGQRPVISFEKIVFDDKGLQFNISQKGTSQVLNCTLPFIQPTFNLSEQDKVGAVFHFMDPYVHNFKMPVDGVRGFSLVQQIEGKEHFVAWFSPEKFLRNWWSQHLDCTIEGDIRPFTRYKVHYVGKATKQNIIKRLTGHSALQDILSLEASVTGMQMPANEIVILPFQFQENVELQSFGRQSKSHEMIAAVRGANFPEQARIFLDAEKAIIRAMNPAYNKELFKSYPTSKDGLYQDRYDAVCYTFRDPITLVYNEGEIVGGPDLLASDLIMISNYNEFKLVKRR